MIEKVKLHKGSVRIREYFERPGTYSVKRNAVVTRRGVAPRYKGKVIRVTRKNNYARKDFDDS